MKKGLFFFFCVFLLSVWTLPASASEEGVKRLEAFLHERIWEGDRDFSCNLNQYGVTRDELETVMSRLYLRPDMFILKGWRYTPSPLSYRLQPAYDENLLSDYDAAKRLYSATVREIADMADPSWNDLEKTLFVHDYMALHYQYDETLRKENAYQFFRDGSGTCQAYTLATEAVLTELGVPCSQVRSESLNHTWNLVKIGGAWYHMDATWDDPTPDSPGWADHTYFLLSTSALKSAKGERAHFASDDWEYGENVLCDSARYDAAFWRPSISRFAYDAAAQAWRYVREDGVYSWDGESSDGERLLSFADLFAERYPRYRFDAYASRAGIYCINGYLLFNTAFQVLTFRPSNGATNVLKDYVSDGANVRDFAFDGERLRWVVWTDGRSAPDSCAVPEEVWAAGNPETPAPTNPTLTPSAPENSEPVGGASAPTNPDPSLANPDAPTPDASAANPDDADLLRGTGDIPRKLWNAVLDVTDAVWEKVSSWISGGVSKLSDAEEGSIENKIGQTLSIVGQLSEPARDWMEPRNIRPAHVILVSALILIILNRLGRSAERKRAPKRGRTTYPNRASGRSPYPRTRR